MTSNTCSIICPPGWSPGEVTTGRGGVLNAPGRELATSLDLAPGKIVELVGRLGTGMTRLGLSLLASVPGPVAVCDVRGWFCPAAAWEVGVDRERLVVVRCGDRGLWLRVVATLAEGVPGIYAEVPAGVRERDLRRLGALVRARRIRLALRPLGEPLPGGVAHLRLWAEGVEWEGADRGHGRLARRRIRVAASGKGVGGMERTMVVEEDGAGPVRVVSELVPRADRRALG